MMRLLYYPSYRILRAGTVLTLAALSCWLIPVVMAPDSAAATSASTTKPVNKAQKSKQKWIEIYLSSQRLVAWEGTKPVLAVIVSTGKSTTRTPKGTFEIQSKHRIARMRGADYDLDDVPFTMYYSGSYAIHGAYWHKRFGTPVSHGCVNVAVNHARWLFNWASVGTPVVVRP